VKSHTYVLIPVYNDWPCIGPLLREINLAFQRINESASICIVDDHSTIRPEKLLELGMLQSFAHIDQVICLRLARNVGHQAAIAVGLHYLSERSDCAQAVIMDADGEDKPSDIPHLLSVQAQTEEPCIVFASRQSRQGVGLRFRSFYTFYKYLVRLLIGHWIDFGNFSVVPGVHLPTLTLYPELWRHYPATVICSKLRYLVVPCDRGQRYAGESRMTLQSLIVHGLQSIALFSHNIAARMLLVCSVLLVPPALALAVVIAIRLCTNLAIPGWATYTVGLLIVAILQLLAMLLFFTFLILSTPQHIALISPSAYKAFIDSTEVVGRDND
jgi:hypothetical protein